MSLRHGQGQFRLRLLSSHFRPGSDVSLNEPIKWRDCGRQYQLFERLFGNFNPRDAGDSSPRKQMTAIPGRRGVEKAPLPRATLPNSYRRWSRRNGYNANKARSQPGSKCSVEQTRVGDKSATGWQMKRDPETGARKFSLEATYRVLGMHLLAP